MFIYTTLAFCLLATVSSAPIYAPGGAPGDDGYRWVQGFVISGYDIPSNGKPNTVVCAPASCDPKKPLPPGADECRCVGKDCWPSFGYRKFSYFKAMCKKTKGCQAASLAGGSDCAVLKSKGSASVFKTSAAGAVISKQLAPVICAAEVPLGASCTNLGDGKPGLISPVATCCAKSWLNWCSEGKCIAKWNTGGALAGQGR